ncbi:hypothetical protein LBMAG43_12490 [Methylococcaceae bacterium]|nr:hypothetical protein LBMAG43_12490 [Methylococcaceae bacterium]
MSLSFYKKTIMDMNQNKQTVTCPKCTHQFNAGESFYQQIETELRQSFEAKSIQNKTQFEYQLKAEKEQYERLTTTVNAEKLQIDLERQSMLTKIEETVKQQVKDEKTLLEQTLRANIKANIEAENAEQIQQLNNDLNEKSEKLKEFSRAKAEIARLTREKDELTEAVKAEAALELNRRLREEKQKIESSLELKMRDKEYEIERLKNQIQEAQRVAEQVSNQAQGEAQELAIEEWLHAEFPFDDIEEIKKGQRGADCIQIVHTRSRHNCGKIYYESKRTLEFGKDWIEKFKADLQAKNIHVGVLVTQAMPKDMDRMGLKDGVYVCTFEEFKSLSVVLRQSIIDISNIEIAQEFKGEKMAQLYDFLTSTEFKLNIQAIVESFIQMEEDLNKERRSMESLWKQREKQIRKVMSNTSALYGSIRGIAGNAIQSVPQLESNVPMIDATKSV